MDLSSEYISINKPKVAIIIPFRDPGDGSRTKQLNTIIPYLTEYMTKIEKEVKKWKIFVAIQSDDNLKFNRGYLFNSVVNRIIKQDFDTLIFHDVDLLPSYELAKWYISKPVKKIAYNIGFCWDRYREKSKIPQAEGIISIRTDDFLEADGFPNIFWGWGGEDDELVRRLIKNECKIIGPNPYKDCIKDLENLNYFEKKNFFKENKTYIGSMFLEIRHLHKQIDKLNYKKQKWWGLKNVKNKIKILKNTKTLQIFLVFLKINTDDNFSIKVHVNKNEILSVNINNAAKKDFYIDYSKYKN